MDPLWGSQIGQNLPPPQHFHGGLKQEGLSESPDHTSTSAKKIPMNMHIGGTLVNAPPNTESAKQQQQQQVHHAHNKLCRHYYCLHAYSFPDASHEIYKRSTARSTIRLPSLSQSPLLLLVVNSSILTLSMVIAQ